MKLYIENRENKMFEAMFRHMACLMIDRFQDTSEDNKIKLAWIKNFETFSVKVVDKDGVDVLVESGKEYGLMWMKITAVDSSFQLESDLMDMQAWNTVWAWMDHIPSVKVIEEVV